MDKLLQPKRLAFTRLHAARWRNGILAYATRRQFKLWMTKAIITLTAILISVKYSNAQIPDTTRGYLDFDNMEDTICYRYVEDSARGAYYSIALIRGRGKRQQFEIGVGFESMVISSSRRGIIETWQWKGGNTGFEIETIYEYNTSYDDWIEIKMTISSPGEPTEVFRNDVPKGISGREYPKKKKLQHRPAKRRPY